MANEKKQWKNSVWVVEVNYQRKGCSEDETYLFDEITDARSWLQKLINRSKVDGIIADYLDDVGTDYESSWEIDDRITADDYYEINGNDGDYYEQFRIYEQRVHQKGEEPDMSE